MTEPGDDSAHPMIGQVLGERYRIEALLGEGGMGAVFRATHLSLDRPVAVKVLHPRLSSDEHVAKRFDREALAVSKLDHPNCVQVIDFGTTAKGMKYLVMQYLEGRELRDLTGFGLPIEQAVDFGIQILRALEHAHKRGLVHRDLKPENIYLVEDDDGHTVCKLVDFGIVKLLEGEGQEKLTRMGMAFGTPTYMSPEQAAGGKIDERTDLYAVGVLLYELLTGMPPFDADEPGILLRMHILADPPPLPDTVPKAVANVVLKLLSKEPGDRYADAREARRTLAGSYRLPARTTGRIGVVSVPPPNVATDPAAVATAADAQVRAPTHAEAESDTGAEPGAAPGVAGAAVAGAAVAGAAVAGAAVAGAAASYASAPAPPPPAPAGPAPPPPAPAAPAPELFASSGGTVLAGSDASMSHGAAPAVVPAPTASMSYGSVPMGPMSSGVAPYDPLAASSSNVPVVSPPHGIHSSGAHAMSGPYPMVPPGTMQRPPKRRSPVVPIVLALLLLTWATIAVVWLMGDDSKDASPGPGTPGAVAAPGLYRFTDGADGADGGSAGGSGDAAADQSAAEADPAPSDPAPTATRPPPSSPREGKGKGKSKKPKKHK